MTELEEARAHLRRSQEWLRMARAGYTNHFGIYVQPGSNSDTIRRCAEDVLSALSWVYDAQERERKSRPYVENVWCDKDTQSLNMTLVIPQ